VRDPHEVEAITAATMTTAVRGEQSRMAVMLAPPTWTRSSAAGNLNAAW
jgi:hypothetical protein